MYRNHNNGKRANESKKGKDKAAPAPVIASRPHIQVDEHTTINLLKNLFISNSPNSETVRARQYVQELRLISADTTGLGINWHIRKRNIQDLNTLPLKQRHSGHFDWIGRESHGIPQWLYDAYTKETVPTTPAILLQGYIAVSWTWGRFQDGSRMRRSAGTPWDVPLDKTDVAPNLLSRLKANLKALSIKNKQCRYFWVDVLCIDQSNDEEKRREIQKQAGIFKQAKGVIAFLWTYKDSEFSLSKAVEDIGSLLSWALTFTNVDTYKNSINSSGRRFYDNEMQERFAKLRGDYWFTSLWALQEIVLAPHMIWMTRSGETCMVNGQYLTTRFLAVALRLLSWAASQRDLVWEDAKLSYMKTHQLDAERFSALLEAYESERQEVKEALKKEVQSLTNQYQSAKPPLQQVYQGSQSRTHWALVSQYSDQSQSEICTDAGIVVESKSVTGDVPWIVARYEQEFDLRNEIEHFTAWTFGTACIDVAISATRTAILLAGSNRDVVVHKSREEALLAALKVESIYDVIAQDTPGSGHLSMNLVNVILKKDGPRLFDVISCRPKPRTITKEGSDFDGSSWELADIEVPYTHVQEISMSASVGLDSTLAYITARKDTAVNVPKSYIQRGRMKYAPPIRGGKHLLTGMLPDSESQLNPLTLQLAHQASFGWVSVEDWHMHSRGILHIPKYALIQRLFKKKTPCSMRVFLNGTSVPYEVDRTGDVTRIFETQKWIVELLGAKPRIKLLPLAVRSGISRRSTNGPAKHHLSSSLLLGDDLETIGVVLVAREVKHQPRPISQPSVPEYWYKFGTYVASGTEFERENFDNGILVGSFNDEVYALEQPESNKEYTKELFEFLEKRASGGDGGFEMIDVSEYFGFGDEAGYAVVEKIH